MYPDIKSSLGEKERGEREREREREREPACVRVCVCGTRGPRLVMVVLCHLCTIKGGWWWRGLQEHIKMRTARAHAHSSGRSSWHPEPRVCAPLDVVLRLLDAHRRERRLERVRVLGLERLLQRL